MDILSLEERTRLLSGAMEGDEESFNGLWEAYEKAIMAFISTRINASSSRDMEKVHDIAQDTFLLLRKKIHTYNSDRARLYTFMAFWAKIAMLRYFRKEGKRLESVMLIWEYAELDGDEAAQSFIDKLPDFDPLCVDILVELDMYKTLLRLTFREGGYPHQLLAFGFNRLIAEWSPRSIAEKWSGHELSKLESEFEREYIADSKLEQHEVRRCLEPLRARIGQSVADVISDKATMDNLLDKAPDCIGVEVGRTKLRFYYTGDPPVNISEWTYKVRKRIRKYILDSGDFV